MKDPLESKEQIALVRHYRERGYILFHVPNGGKKTKAEAMKLKLEGVLAGVPDLIFILDNGKTLWVELKRRKGGVVSRDQKDVHAELERLGHVLIVAKGAKDAFDKIENALLTILGPALK